MSSTSVLNYSESTKTINIFPQYVFDEDLMPDCGVEFDAICTEIHKDGVRIQIVLSKLLGILLLKIDSR